MSDPPQKQAQDSHGVGHDIALLFVLFFREIIVDFLAILIPGFWFIAASIPAFFLPLFVFVQLWDGGDRPHAFVAFNQISRNISGFHTEILFFLILISWLIGHLMFRQDQRRPDQLSWILSNIENSKPSKLRSIRWLLRTVGQDISFPIRDEIDRAVKFDGMVQPLPGAKCLEEVRVEYPYSHLKDYLIRRGYKMIADIVSWDATKLDPQMSTRSKNFINERKAKLEFNFPEKIRELARIESHIRLHSSLWYACFYLRYMSIFGMALGIVSNWILWRRLGMPNHQDWFVFMLPLLVYIVTFFFGGLIERAFHYQRSREVFYVLTFSQLAGEGE